jgi:hypothetical protein
MNKAAHILWIAAALGSLAQTVNLGWIGHGLRPIDASKPCAVRSRALLLEHETTEGCAVLSFHDAI